MVINPVLLEVMSYIYISYPSLMVPNMGSTFF